MNERENSLARTDNASVVQRSDKSDVAAFLARAKVSAGKGVGRLVFAMDATMSRQPTWDRAMHEQAAMFDAVGKLGTLDVQLVYFRGFGESRASKWVSDTKALRSLMEKIDCRGGRTQIGKVLKHTLNENTKRPVSALAFVGDAMEENVDELCQRAGELGLRKVPCFMFHEGRDGTTERAFREIARLSNGAYVRFGAGSSSRLADLLGAVAAYSAGGLKALEARGGEGDRLLLTQMKR